MNTLELPIEALAFHNLSFFISAVAHNLRAWLAAISYVLRVIVTAPSRSCVVENNPTGETVKTAPLAPPSSEKSTASSSYVNDGVVELKTNDAWCAASNAAFCQSGCTITDDGCHGFCGCEGWLWDEPVVACYEQTLAAETAAHTIFAQANYAGNFNMGEPHDLYWNRILRMRNGDSVGRCRDIVLDGNVVKLWDRSWEGFIY